MQRGIKPAEERFWPKVEKRDDGCWHWTAAKTIANGKHLGGYGRFRRGRASESMVFAHRFAYELLVGPIPAGLELDHSCRNRSCVNPEHLEAVTKQENARRAVSARQMEVLA